MGLRGLAGLLLRLEALDHWGLGSRVEFVNGDLGGLDHSELGFRLDLEHGEVSRVGV